MVQRRIVELVDDLDGGSADETVSFGLDGRSYEIDLSAKNAKKLRKALEPYEKPARKLGAKRSVSGASTSGASDAGVIREWALSNGYDVNTRGRIPAHVREAYASS